MRLPLLAGHPRAREDDPAREVAQQGDSHEHRNRDDDRRRNWLKVHCVLAKSDGWVQSLFGAAPVTRMGVLVDARVPVESQRGEAFYALEYEPGLILVFSTATQEDYETALEKRIDETPGLAKMWVRPDMFEGVWRGVLDRFGGRVYWFISRRSANDSTPAELRPGYARRLNYSGEDATDTMRELLSIYGVLPESLKIQASDELKVQITNEGLFAAQHPTRTAIEILRFFVESVKDRVLALKATSESLRFGVQTVYDGGGPRVATVDAGEILLEGRSLDQVLVDSMLENFEGFSFLDTHTEQGSLSFVATVVDRQKGTVFEVSASEDGIRMIPKYNASFESFLSFYRAVVEWIDDKATMRVFGQYAGGMNGGSGSD